MNQDPFVFFRAAKETTLATYLQWLKQNSTLGRNQAATKLFVVEAVASNQLQALDSHRNALLVDSSGHLPLEKVQTLVYNPSDTTDEHSVIGRRSVTTRYVLRERRSVAEEEPRRGR